MQFHHHGYISTDPRRLPASSVGESREADLPDMMDVLIIGAGPAGMVTAAQLSQYGGVHTRIIEQRAERLEFGHADGVQARSMEMFQAFGFANRLSEEAYHITEMAVWNPDPENPDRIVRTARPADDPQGISEFPHVTISQARILDYFAEFMANSPTRMTPNYGIKFIGLEVTEEHDYPVAVTVRYTAGPKTGEERTVRAKYVVGTDGARSNVRRAIGRKLEGKQANHAWGVMDVLIRTDFPDYRLRTVIHSNSGGSILIIPREGGHLIRLYVDLGEVDGTRSREIRDTTMDEVIERANAILYPYTIDVRHIVWSSVYEVGHRITDKFDNAEPGAGTPRVFIAGDACHTHSAKAAQGMNVSMADGFNLGWKLGQVISGLSPESLLETYNEERRVVAQNLIDFDMRWSTLLAKKPSDFTDPDELEDFVLKNAEFPAGFMTQYERSMITGNTSAQGLAKGFDIGKRFKSARVARICDGNPTHIGHVAQSDGRWRIYAFADRSVEGRNLKLDALAKWLHTDTGSPLIKYTSPGADLDQNFVLNVIYQELASDRDLNEVPEAFRPIIGKYRVRNDENAYGILLDEDIFEERGIDRNGAVVIVRPDQYVAHVLSLDDTEGIAEFFDQNMLPQENKSRALIENKA